MKVEIGPFTNWVGPYQIAEMILFWRDKYEDDGVHKLGERLASIPGLSAACEWIHSKKTRKVKVHIDNYDVWNMGDTLAYVIVPMLKELRRQKQGCPMTDHEDGPWYFAIRRESDDEHNYTETGSFNQQRWDWILDEMIWAFEQQLPETDWEARYNHGVIDHLWLPCEDKDGFNQLTHGPNHTYWWDKEGCIAHQKAINNGMRLFGKYYNGLWD